MGKTTGNEIIEAEIVKDNDGKKARQKAKLKRKANDIILPIIADVILLAFGVCLLVWADKVTSFISIAIGSFFIIYSLYNFISYIRAKEDEKQISKIVVGLAMLIAGIFLCVQTDFIKESISFVIGSFIIIMSIIRLQDALKFRTLSPDFRLPAILSITGIITGLLCILGKIIIPDLVLQILGVMLAIFAISNIANNISIKNLSKKYIQNI